MIPILWSKWESQEKVVLASSLPVFYVSILISLRLLGAILVTHLCTMINPNISLLKFSPVESVHSIILLNNPQAGNVARLQPSTCSERDCIKFIAPPVDNYNYKVNIILLSELMISATRTPMAHPISAHSQHAHATWRSQKVRVQKIIKANLVPDHLLWPGNETVQQNVNPI